MTKDEIRQLAEDDLITFAKLVNPNRMYGDIHEDVFRWWMTCDKDNKDNTVLLLPRDHQKSHCAAVKAAWTITKDPTRTILYISATSALAEKQLRAIKQILESDVYRRYWPDMIHAEEGRREVWNNTEICVDHPARKAEGVRDSSVFAAGLTTNITGFHATDVFLDDMVVPNNAYTEEGRNKVEQQYSQLASIETTGATETVVGTIYHPADIYEQLKQMTEPVYDEDGEIVDEVPVYEFKEHVVETDQVFLWPRAVRADNKAYGFNLKELARKKAKYLDKTQFFAQYYLQANDPGSNRLQYDKFQYFKRENVTLEGGRWNYAGKPLNVYAAVDFAFSLSAKADYTAIVVIGVDPSNNIYVLDIARFKTDRISVYFEQVVKMHEKWEFRKLRAEVTVAQAVIARDLKERLKEAGLSVSIDEHRPTKNKDERIMAALEPRYENQQVWHFKGGHTPSLEEELVLARPPHDDIKDCLAAVVEIAIRPKQISRKKTNNVLKFNRFGGNT